LLETHELTKRFGGVAAINELSFKIEKGEIRGLIGPNGSGKTTLMNLINGIISPTSGQIYFAGQRIDKLEPHEISHRGIARTFQISKLFMKMTVSQNLLTAFYTTHSHADKEAAEEKSLKVLEFLELSHLKDELAGRLSGGQQILMEIGRTLMMDPILCLMDEPFAGVSPVIKGKIVDSLREMNEKGITFVIVSHEMPTVKTLCKKTTVLSQGQIIAEGDMTEIANDARVIDAYLGG